MFEIIEKTFELNNGHIFADFELDAYAQLDIELDLTEAAEIEIALGEVRSGESVNREPGGYRIARTMKKLCPAGKSLVEFELTKHKSPYPYTISVPLPPDANDREITPFRYAEINGGKGKATLRRKAFYGDFDDSASDFKSSSDQLNKIWDFCKYTMKATAAFGIYIDGERERQPYEGDALINLLGHLAAGGAPETAKITIDWLLEHPTYFTEWLLITPFLIRDYELYTGDSASVKKWLPKMEELFARIVPENDDLLHDAPLANRTPGIRRDLIDWPAPERDNYELKEVNLVPNTYYYASLLCMADLTGKASYQAQAGKVKAAIHKYFCQGDLFIDSVGSEHTSLHSAFYPAFFKAADLSDAARKLIIEKGMACSVYTAHHLLEFCFDHNLTGHAYNLMLSRDLRSFQNMLDKGATMAMESWDDSCKPNQDWNHAWGAAPACAIPRCVAGIRPLEPGFKKFSVNPQPGPLTDFYIKHPTPHGSITLSYDEKKYLLTVPENTQAVVGTQTLDAGEHSFCI